MPRKTKHHKGFILSFIIIAVAIILTGAILTRIKTLPPEPEEIKVEAPPEIKDQPPPHKPKIVVEPQLKPETDTMLLPTATTTVSTTTEDSPKTQFIIPSSIAEKPVDTKTIVLIRCHFQNQYYEISAQPWNEERYSLGSGVIVSDKGHILTAKHIFEVDKSLLNDSAGRIWERKKCAAAQTNAEQTPIHPLDPAPGVPEFKDVEIVFEPSSIEYNNTKDLDFILIKITDPGSKLPYYTFPQNLIRFAKDDQIIAIGYPGKDVNVPQKLERLDGLFSEMAILKDSSCDGTIKPCGLRYLITRSLSKYQSRLWQETELGIITPFFRGGFSGGPAFYKGRLIGIVTHGESGQKVESNNDEVLILTSFDISETLEKHSVSF